MPSKSLSYKVAEFFSPAWPENFCQELATLKMGIS
jgi:hypothetical protein